MSDSAALSDVPGVRRPRITVVDILRFLCELIAFGTLMIWGFAGWPLPWNIVIGIGAPALAIAAWALFVSPKAVLRVHPFVVALVELCVFASATLVFWALGLPWLGLGFGVIAVASGVITGRRRVS